MSKRTRLPFVADIPGQPNYCATQLGQIFRRGGPVLKPYNNRWGYPIVTLCHGGKRVRASVHRLVMLAFRGPSLLCVDHINYNKEDNRLENLRYLSYSENTRRSFADGRRPKSSRAGYTAGLDRAKSILKASNAGLSGVENAKMHGVSQSTVSAITMGRVYPEAAK